MIGNHTHDFTGGFFRPNQKRRTHACVHCGEKVEVAPRPMRLTRIFKPFLPAR